MLRSLILLALLVAAFVAAPDILFHRLHVNMADPDVALIVRSTRIALIVGIALAAAFVFDRALRLVFWTRGLKRWRGREVPAMIRDMATIVILVVGAAIGAWAAGSTSMALMINLVLSTSVIGFVAGRAAEGPLQDIFSGLTISFDHTYGIGDWLTIYREVPPNVFFGRVEAITWRSTVLRQEDSTFLVVPNRFATAYAIVNHNHRPYSIEITAEMSVDIRVASERVIDMLMGEAIKATRQPGFAREPPPEVFLRELSGDAATYEVSFHAQPELIFPRRAKTIVMQRLQKVVEYEGIWRPSHRIEASGRFHGADALSEAEIVELLLRIDLFRGVLTSEQATALAKRSHLQLLPLGARLIEKGKDGASMFVIIEGAARVWSVNPAGTERDIAILARGDVVGEMSLLMGAQRNATVTALTNLRAIEVTKDAIEALVRQSPQILERFSHILARRQHELEEILQRPDDVETRQVDLLNQMANFFRKVLEGMGEPA